MRIGIDYDVAVQRHPEHVKEILNALRASSSKERHRYGPELVWRYDFAMSVRAYSFAEIASGKPKEDREPFDVEHILKRISVYLGASYRRWWRASSTPIEVAPPEIVAWAEQHVARCKAFEEGPKRPVEEILGELGQQPGFVAITIRKDK